ncbi:DNA internalization-related competence protein ComEC/Rec2 [Cytobacillus spongiae]|uniref:DNA internalization-related competence protein ComEC/Rec2 n=1 Tax=Cytobacillus spongiae TaxID=2901381 RepID=UPI001F2C6AD0|nr:DNA internalization-related competence protein ComEC/Rec2 [Cytobacillus spongiae]UII54943.1 DNA internalization-related competence protein ComEC/Rec2 [Cytobacillus spongiae]
MKGKYIYVALFSLIGTWSASELTGLIGLLIGIVYLWKIKGYHLKFILLCCMVFLIFFGNAKLSLNKVSDLSLDFNNFTIEFQSFKIDGNRLTGTATEWTTEEKVMLNYKIMSSEEKKVLTEKLQYGLLCQVHGELEEPNQARNPNAFDYKTYLKHQDIYWVLSISSLTLEACQPNNKLTTKLFKLRSDGLNDLQEHFPKDTVAIVAALLFGERKWMEKSLLEDYQELGIVHILAISGLHVGLLVGFAFYSGIRMGLTRERMATLLLFILPVYPVITGFSPSVNRAAGMVFLLLLSQKIGFSRKWLPVDIISIVLLVYLFISPSVIFHVGFQLSFIVTFALILSSPKILLKATHPISLIATTSFIAQISAFPILLHSFYEISLISIFANVIFIPIFSFIVLPLCIGLYLLHLVSFPFINPLLLVLSLIIQWVNKLASFLTTFPYTTALLGKPSKTEIIGYIISIPLLFLSWERKRLFPVLISLLCLVGIIHLASQDLSSSGEITVIDVGQGDCIFIRLPYGKGNYLIDTGGRVSFNDQGWKERLNTYDVGSDVVVPFLKSKGISKLDKLILTHGDADHIQGSFGLLEDIDVEEILLPNVEEQPALVQLILNNAIRKGVRVQYVSKGDTWTSGDTLFQILSPSRETMQERNNGSIVIYTEIGGLSWLFTGDLEEQGEKVLVKNYPNLKIDVLKAGHHGSNSSTSEPFLQSIQPRMSIISAGVNNRYGHPHQEVLSRLAQQHVQILRTDQHGAITYKFSGMNGTFSAQLP